MPMKKPVHPGEILREDVLADLELSVGEAASRLGISRVALSRVLHGHARISPNLAVRLEEAGVGTPGRGWPCSPRTTLPPSAPQESRKCASSIMLPDQIQTFFAGPPPTNADCVFGSSYSPLHP
jgi:addiction module HigA family antidote